MRTNAASRLRLAAALALACAGSGCTTTMFQVSYFGGYRDGEDMPLGLVYAGTLGDAAMLVHGWRCCSSYSPAGHFVGFFDLPLSLAADTALLPVTIGETIELAARRPHGRADGAPELTLDDLR